MLTSVLLPPSRCLVLETYHVTLPSGLAQALIPHSINPTLHCVTTVTYPLMISYLKILFPLELLSQVKNRIHPFLQSQFPSSKLLVCFNGTKILPDLNFGIIFDTSHWSPTSVSSISNHLALKVLSSLGHRSLPLSFCSQTLWGKECGKVCLKIRKHHANWK